MLPKRRSQLATLSVYFEQRRVGTIDIDKNGPGTVATDGAVAAAAAIATAAADDIGASAANHACAAILACSEVARRQRVVTMRARD